MNASTLSQQRVQQRAELDGYITMVQRMGKENFADQLKLDPANLESYDYSDLAQLLSGITLNTIS